jgi:hypothetical protein
VCCELAGRGGWSVHVSLVLSGCAAIFFHAHRIRQVSTSATSRRTTLLSCRCVRAGMWAVDGGKAHCCCWPAFTGLWRLASNSDPQHVGMSSLLSQVKAGSGR